MSLVAHTPPNRPKGGLWDVPVVGQLARVGTGVVATIGQIPTDLAGMALKGVGAVAGAMGEKKGQAFYSGAGQAVENVGKAIFEKPEAKQLDTTSGLIGRGIGVLASFLSPTKAVSTLPAVQRFSEGKILKSIDTQVENVLKQTRGVQTKVQLAGQKNIPLKDILTEPVIFRGLKVQDGKVNPDEAITTIQNRIDALMHAKSQMLPEIDRLSPAISKDALLQEAISTIKGQKLPKGESELIAKITSQVNAMPAEFKPSELDAVRAVARKEARDAKGIQKPGDVFTALENAARNLVFKATDNLPKGVDPTGQFARLNDNVKNLIGTSEFLDKTMRGQIMKGGRAGDYIAKIIGAAGGSSHGVIGALAGSEIMGTVAHIIRDNQLGSDVKMKLIENITDDPKILKEAQDFLGKLRTTPQMSLPAPAAGAPRSAIMSGQTIPVAPAGSQMEFPRAMSAVGQQSPGVGGPVVAPSMLQEAPKTLSGDIGNFLSQELEQKIDPTTAWGKAGFATKKDWQGALKDIKGASVGGKEETINKFIGGKIKLKPGKSTAEWKEMLGSNYYKIFKKDAKMSADELATDSGFESENDLMDSIRNEVFNRYNKKSSEAAQIKQSNEEF